MRPFDEIPFEETDYSDVALLVASVREWPSDDFARDLDARVARRFAPEAAPAAGRAGPAGGRGRIALDGRARCRARGRGGRRCRGGLERWLGWVVNGCPAAASRPDLGLGQAPRDGTAARRRPGPRPTRRRPHRAHVRKWGGERSERGQPERLRRSGVASSTASAPVAPGGKQIRSAQISLTTPERARQSGGQ